MQERKKGMSEPIKQVRGEKFPLSSLVNWNLKIDNLPLRVFVVESSHSKLTRQRVEVAT